MKQAAFFDRDGTINVDVGYLYRPEELKFIKETVKIIRKYNEIGWPVLVVTNQSGIARGYFTQKDLHALHEQMNRYLADEFNAHIDAFYYCPHLPEITGKCDCRKPKPGLFFRAAREWDVNLAQSVSFGDSARDEEASRTAGIRRFYYV